MRCACLVRWIGRQSGNLHLLLEDVRQDGTPLLLYHAESGDVETLPFADVWHIQERGTLHDGFTPDGGWLTLRTPFGTAFGGDVSWLRAVDGQRADVFAAPHGAGVSAGDGAGRVAVNRAADWEQVDVLSLPGGEVLQSWRFEGYSLTVEAWSPDGRTLVLSGNRRAVWPDELESGPQALFLADVANPPQP